ncbi:MAG: energy transducer TonB, partial [Casimicrobium sp.]
MDYTYKPASSNKRTIAVFAVIALHAFIVYALVTGLARKAVDVIKKPLEAKIVEEVKLPPPP